MAYAPPAQYLQPGCRLAGRRTFALTLLGVVTFFALWSQAFWVPFWQDDYAFLPAARDAQRAGDARHRAILPSPGDTFWRPLSVQVYWRLLEGITSGDLRAAHASSLLLLAATAAVVGWLTAAILRIRSPEADATSGGAAAAFLYGIHGSHFLSAVWPSGVQDTLMVLFSAMALRFWLAAATSRGPGGLVAGIGAAACFALALLSKEGAVTVLLLQVLLFGWLPSKQRTGPRAWGFGLLMLGVAVLWWFVRSRMAIAMPPSGPYELRVGGNVVRNAASLGLFLLSVPREALRLILETRSLGAGLWAAACLTLQAGGWLCWFRNARVKPSRRDVFTLAGFMAVGLAPYLLLSWNCYAYYTSIALVGLAVFAGLFTPKAKAAWCAMVLFTAASAVCTLGNHLLDYPAILARAHWGQRQLDRLRLQYAADPQAFHTPIEVVVEDQHKFQAFGVDGLAYTLDLRPSDIVVLGPGQPGTTGRPVLVVPREGDVRFERRTP